MEILSLDGEDGWFIAGGPSAKPVREAAEATAPAPMNFLRLICSKMFFTSIAPKGLLEKPDSDWIQVDAAEGPPVQRLQPSR